MRSNINTAAERIGRAREKVGALRATLLSPSPEALESHVPALEEALHELQHLQQDHEKPGGLGPHLLALAGELRIAGKLIEHGLAFERGWARLLAAAAGSYQPNGEPHPLPVRGSISVRG